MNNVTPVIYGDMIVLNNKFYIPIEYFAELPEGGVQHVLVLGHASEYLGK